MSITRHHTGRWLFQFDKVIAGQRVRANKLLPAGTPKQKANDFDQRETQRLWEAATGGEQPEQLIDDAVLGYLKEHAPHLKNHDDIVGALLILQPYYTGRPLSQLADVAREYIEKVEGIKPATVRNRLAYLRAACRWSWKHLGMGQHDPAERMVLPKVKNARNVYLSRAEMLRICRAMGYGWSRDVARVAFYTGMRAGEILRSEATESGGLLALRVDDTKNGAPRIVPVHRRIAHLVRGDWPPQVTVWTASKTIKAAMREVGLGHARQHDLRHSAASEMINAGVDLYTVGGVLGHKSTVSTSRYAHLATSKLREAVGLIGSAKNPQPEPKKKAA